MQPLVRILSLNKGLFVAVCILSGLMLGIGVSQQLQRADTSVVELALVARQIVLQLTRNSAPNSIAVTDVSETSTGTAPSSATITSIEPDRGHSRHSYHEGIVRVAPSVVSIYASAEGSDNSASASQGSGVIVDPGGMVLTNLHLLDGKEVINVVLGDGSQHIGTLIGSDRETDLAVVSIDARGLPAVDLDAAAPLRVGDIVLAIGNPFGVGQTVTQGIVSATRRRVAGGSAWQDFVQIDAAINPGSSGGALINPDGQLVGVTTAVFRGAMPGEGNQRGDIAQGIGFAIPTGLLARAVPDMIRDGRVVRGWLGVGADDLPMFPDLHRSITNGAVVTSVLAESPAALAGLRRHDVVTALDGQPISDATELLLLVSSFGPGSEIELDIQRGPSTLVASVTLGERPGLANVLPR